MIPFPEIRCLRRYGVMVDGGQSQPSHPEYGLAIETSGQTLCVGQCRDRDRVDQLREDLEWHLRDRYAAWVNEREYVDCEILDASAIRPEPPWDSTLSCRREWDRTEFVRRIQEKRPSVLDGLAFILLVFGLACTPPTPSAPSIARVLVPFLVMAGLLLLAASARRNWVVRHGRDHDIGPGRQAGLAADDRDRVAGADGTPSPPVERAVEVEVRAGPRRP